MLIRAKHVVPVDGPAIKNGAVRIAGDHIAEVGSAKSVDGSPTIDFGDAVILPGFVNAHTHLELGYCSALATDSLDFIAWLDRLIDARRRSIDLSADMAGSVRDGVHLSLSAGVTTLGDITTDPRLTRAELTRGPLRVVSFGEVIAMGATRGQLRDRLESALGDAHASGYVSVGVSPHSPYTVEPDGIRACADAATRLRLPLCMHLAETEAESQFTRDAAGPFRTFLERLRLWDGQTPCSHLSPVALAHACGALGSRTVLAHCNYVDDGDINLFVRTGAHVVYCPRTHAAFGHQPHRFDTMLNAGVNVCFGTDSLASNPSLSVLDEVRFVGRMRCDVEPATLIAMGTLRGAIALGLSDVIGTLSPGKSADLTVVPLDPSGSSDALDNLLACDHQPIATYIRGRRLNP